MASLEGQIVLVTGGTGQVGWGVARAAGDAGARLVLPTRSERGAEELRETFPDATVVVADVGAAADVDAVQDAIGGRLDHVVAPMGAWWQGGATLAQPTETVDELLSTYVSAQHQLLVTTADLLRASGGSYTLVTGAAGEHRIHDGGLLVVAVRAQYALADVLRAELRDEPFRFNELRITARLEREPRDGVIPSAEAGEAFVELMASDRRSELVRYPD